MAIKRKTKYIYKDKKNEISEKVKSDFVTIASHQLRTPVSAIRWSLDTLLSGKAGKISEKQKELISQIYQNNNYLGRIVNDLLKIAQLEEKGIKLNFQEIDLKLILKKIIEQFQPFFKAFNCRLILKIQPALPKIYTDPLQISRILEILIDNALRYSRHQQKIIITLKRVGKKIWFEIKDFGIGIPQYQQSLVFSKFFRANNAILAQTQGLGLNLYLVKKIIKILDGRIWFESVENQGTTFYFYLNIRPVKKLKKIFKLSTEKKIVIDEDELNYFYDSISDGLIIINKDLEIVKVNSRVLKLLGILKWQQGLEEINEIIKNPKLIKIFKNKNIFKINRVDLRDETKPLRLIIFPIKTGEVLEGWVIILRDTSGKILAAPSFGRDLKKEREFVTITVHELKGPLGTTKWSLEMLEKENLGKLNAGQKTLIKQIYQDNERLLVLVKDLLNLSKIQEGKFEIKPKPTVLENIVSEIISGFIPEIGKKKIQLVWQKTKTVVPKVLIDSDRTAQVVNNLASNAVKYTPSAGKIAITVKRFSGKELEKIGKKLKTGKLLHTKNKKGYLVVGVKDTGPGIPQGEQQKIFTRFFRGKNVLNSKIEGTGLGLYISKSIVNLQKGDIWFKSAPGKGSEFYFSVPLT